MSETVLSRRGFLKGSGAVLMGTLAASSGAIALITPSRSWALELRHLDEHQSRTLLQFSRHLYPHKTPDDAVYALVVKDLDAAAEDKDTLALLTDGVKQLDAEADGRWLDLDADQRLAQVAALEGTPFFSKVRSTAVVSLYSNDMAYAHFGYPGPEGDPGYLHRGFNDLNWLPDPPADASGPIPKA